MFDNDEEPLTDWRFDALCVAVGAALGAIMAGIRLLMA